jgi:WD40 repeat protein
MGHIRRIFSCCIIDPND